MLSVNQTYTYVTEAPLPFVLKELSLRPLSVCCPTVLPDHLHRLNTGYLRDAARTHHIGHYIRRAPDSEIVPVPCLHPLDLL